MPSTEYTDSRQDGASDRVGMLRVDGAKPEGVVGLVSRTVALSSFLLAILLPAIYLPILVSGYPLAGFEVLTGGLIGLHIVCLVLGHNYLADAVTDHASE